MAANFDVGDLVEFDLTLMHYPAVQRGFISIADLGEGQAQIFDPFEGLYIIVRVEDLRPCDPEFLDRPTHPRTEETNRQYMSWARQAILGPRIKEVANDDAE